MKTPDKYSNPEENSPFLGEREDRDTEACYLKSDEQAPRPWTGYYNVLCALLCAGLVVSIVLHRPSEGQCIPALTAWSPMNEALQLKESNDVFLTRQVYMEKPSNHSEAAWSALEHGGSYGVSDDKLPLVNESTAGRAWHHLPDRLGGGIQAYFEGLHEFHCLTLIHRYLHRDEWDYSDDMYLGHATVPPLQHVEHCIQVLRAKFVCEADTTPYAVVEDATKGLLVDVQTVRKCRDVDKLREWLVLARREQGWERPDVY